MGLLTQLQTLCFSRKLYRYAKGSLSEGAGTAQAVTEGLKQTESNGLLYNPSGFRYAKPTTLVGIWSSCYAAACNTPYSARFSPRCIAHWARSARIPFQGRLNM